jgi:hypothetical protein
MSFLLAATSVESIVTAPNPDSRYKTMSLADRVTVAWSFQIRSYRQHGTQVVKQILRDFHEA